MVLSNTKEKNVGMFYMCRQSIQHNFEVGQYNKPFYQMEDLPMQCKVSKCIYIG